MRYSACIELLFVEEAADPAERIRLAKAAGLQGIEFWLWRNEDLDAIAAALDETGLAVTGFCAEPMVPLTDPARHDEFLEGLKPSIEVAQRLGTRVLFVQAGNDLPGRSRAEQRAALTEGLSKAAEIAKGSGVVLALEPLNTLVDHAGYYLSSTVEGLDIIDAVARPEVGLLYDIYHSAVMGERIEEVLAGRVDRVAHVHLADTPGRHEPGSGALDWQARVDWVARAGYSGMVGLEYTPTGATLESLGSVIKPAS